uniref:anaphase-promoting complex subunit 5-like n=1 Tax=Ciona intestinalis TaxID=7719 RepID=UPI000EF4CE6A|nr:anaphase-promoting complex subunit 5-like [Ciona intestinalis]|eukprot:XP_026691703.1 anaphase-promoting complex subunit 5-like [Ciona intestinalis]
MFTQHGDKFARDQITPHRLSLLILIKNYADICDGKHADYTRMVWQDDFASKRLLDRSILTWLQQSNGSLKEMIRIVGLCSKVLHESFKSMLDAICNFESIENLENFFSNLGYSLFQSNDSDSTLQKCLLGLFCRRMLIYYERLAFCELQPLFDSFIKYCAPNVPMDKPLSDPLSQNGSPDESGNTAVAMDSNKVDDMELECQSEMDSKSSRDSIDTELKASDLKTEKCEEFDSPDYFSRQQADNFFKHQAMLLEHNEADALPPVILQQRIRQFLKTNPELTQAHFLSYLNSLRLGEFCGAMDSLLMFMIRHNWKSFPLFPKLDDENLNKNQRYATLNLALLHLRFGHTEAALAATKESINLAHLSNDPMCLQHSMALLHHLQPKSSRQQMAEEVIKPAKKHGLAELAFNATQAYTKSEGLHNGKPDKLFRNLTASDVLQCSKPLTYFSMTSVTHKASLWRMYGKRWIIVKVLS